MEKESGRGGRREWVRWKSRVSGVERKNGRGGKGKLARWEKRVSDVEN